MLASSMKHPDAPTEASADIRARDELIARAGHDLRTPLAAVLTWLRTLRGEAASAQTLRALEMAERAARELGQILNGVEDAQQLMAGTLQVRKLPVDLVTVVRSAVDSVAPTAEARGLTLECLVARPGVLLRGDGDRLNHALSRVLLAAVVLTSARGGIRVSLEAQASEARVSIRCGGLKLPPALREALVLGPEWPSLAGPGGQVALDLAVACRIVALHGGRITAEALGDGQGMDLTVTLPLSGGEPPAAA